MQHHRQVASGGSGMVVSPAVKCAGEETQYVSAVLGRTTVSKLSPYSTEFDIEGNKLALAWDPQGLFHFRLLGSCNALVPDMEPALKCGTQVEPLIHLLCSRKQSNNEVSALRMEAGGLDAFEWAQTQARSPAGTWETFLQNASFKFARIVAAVATMSASGFVHGDLKPENIVEAVTDTGTFKLVDFGLSFPWTLYPGRPGVEAAERMEDNAFRHHSVDFRMPGTSPLSYANVAYVPDVVASYALATRATPKYATLPTFDRFRRYLTAIDPNSAVQAIGLGPVYETLIASAETAAVTLSAEPRTALTVNQYQCATTFVRMLHLFINARQAPWAFSTAQKAVLYKMWHPHPSQRYQDGSTMYLEFVQAFVNRTARSTLVGPVLPAATAAPAAPVAAVASARPKLERAPEPVPQLEGLGSVQLTISGVAGRTPLQTLVTAFGLFASTHRSLAFKQEGTSLLITPLQALNSVRDETVFRQLGACWSTSLQMRFVRLAWMAAKCLQAGEKVGTKALLDKLAALFSGAGVAPPTTR